MCNVPLIRKECNLKTLLRWCMETKINKKRQTRRHTTDFIGIIGQGWHCKDNWCDIVSQLRISVKTLWPAESLAGADLAKFQKKKRMLMKLTICLSLHEKNFEPGRSLVFINNQWISQKPGYWRHRNACTFSLEHFTEDVLLSTQPCDLPPHWKECNA